jgi:hypothetical protein
MALLPVTYLVYGFIHLAKKRKQQDEEGHKQCCKDLILLTNSHASLAV